MPEPGDVDRRSGGSWGLRVAVLIGALYWLCLEFVYGGRFEPWIPSSDDFYLFFTPSPVFLSDVLRQPRLVGFAVVNVLNKFGLTATGAGIIVLSLATLALLVATAREILGAAPRWATTAVYLLAVFTNPHYFEAQVFDFYHTIGVFFLGALLFVWYRAEARGQPPPLAALLVLAVLAVGSKETLVPAVVLFLGYHAFLGAPEHRTRARILLAASVLAVAGLLVHGHLIARYSWVRLDLGRGTPYRIGIEGFLPILGRYLAGFAPWPTLVLIALALAVPEDRRTGLLFVAVGVSTYVPMALLPDHVFDFYGWMGVAIGYVPLLLVDPRPLTSPAEGADRPRTAVARIMPVLAALLLAVNAWRGSRAVVQNQIVASKDHQEKVLASFDTLRRHLGGSTRMLVLGLTSDHPFTPKGARYVAQELLSGGGALTVATYGVPMDHSPRLSRAERERPALEWRDHALAVRESAAYDVFAAYAPDGSLLDVVSREDLAEMMRVALPAGAGPGDVESLLMAGRTTVRRYEAAAKRTIVLPCPRDSECVLTPPTVALHATAQGLEVHAADTDPQILLADLPYDVSEGGLLYVDLTVPAPTVLQLFYQVAAHPQYSERRSLMTPLEAGRNVRILEIPAAGLVGRLRLDPGGVSGDYVIHSVELRQE